MIETAFELQDHSMTKVTLDDNKYTEDTPSGGTFWRYAPSYVHLWSASRFIKLLACLQNSAIAPFLGNRDGCAGTSNIYADPRHARRDSVPPDISYTLHCL